MNGREIWNAVERLQANASHLTSLAYAIYDALYEGPNSSESFDGAMHILCTLLNEHAKKLGALHEQVTV